MSEVRQTDPKTGGQKGQKSERYDLIPYEALDEVSRVYAFGATKYDDHNWRRGYPWSWSLSALGRHFAAILKGEDRDPESGCLHAAHVAWHALTLITFYLCRLGTDDRYKPKPDPLAYLAYEVGSHDEPIPFEVTEPEHVECPESDVYEPAVEDWQAGEP